MAAGLQLPEKLFSLWTTLYSMEVSHANYSPEVVKDKEMAIKSISKTDTQDAARRASIMKRLEKLTVTDENNRPVTKEEREEAERRLRRRHLHPVKS